MIESTRLSYSLALLLVALLINPSGVAAERPNILLVVADDMGWTDIGSFGSEIDTPSLDALAREGVVFTDHHVSVSCSPTRSMLLSGNDNHIAGLGNMGELLDSKERGQPGYEGYLNQRVVSLAEVLQSNGYHTYMAGKWHLGHEPGRFPSDRGFEQAFSLLYGGASHWADAFGPLAHQPQARYSRNGKIVEQLPDGFYSSRSYTDFLMEAIRENRADGKPFLAYLAFTAPHDPLHVPEPWLSRYRGRYDQGYEVLKMERAEAAKALKRFPAGAPTSGLFAGARPWQDLSEEERELEARGMEVYAGMVSNMDYHFGRLVDFLEDIGELDNTLVIFMSDNGPNPWYSEDYPGNEGSEWFAQFDNDAANIGHPLSHYAYGLGWGSASSGPLNLFKLTAAEGGIRSPMVIAGTGVKGERQVDAFTYVWDIMPTILDIAGIEHPEKYADREVEPLRGRSLVGLMSGKADTVYGENDFIGGDLGGSARWGRKGDLKILWVGPPYGGGAWALYDLAADPGETRDLSGEQPEKLAELLAEWEAYADDVGVIR